MGCAGSKLEDLEAVALCRDRSRLLAEAIGYRYAMADAHAVYTRSLRSVGDSLHRFLDEMQRNPAAPSSPRLQLPPQRKGEIFEKKSVEAAHSHSHSHSHSGSHIHFHSDDEDEDEDDDFPLHSDASSSPIDFHHDSPPPRGHTVVHYAKSQPPNPSVTYEQRPVVYEEASTSSSYPYYGYPYSNPNPNFYSSPYGYQSSYGGGYGEMGGYFGSSSPPMGSVPQAPVAERVSSPKGPPPPPSPPRVSTWDFLNPFGNYESYYGAYTPSRSSKDVREEEGIPDLEDEESEVVKGVYAKGKGLSPDSDSSKGDRSSEVREEREENKKRKSVDVGTSGENVDSMVVEKNVVVDEVKQPEVLQNVAALPLKRYHDVSEVVHEIKLQFERASNSAVEVSKMLEVGKQQYNQKSTVYKVSLRMVCGGNPLSLSKDELLVFEDEKAMGSGNLSSTLQKLYIWEKKLFDEVKAEEKMRIFHDKKRREMKRLDERGAEAHKLDSTLAEVRKLSTKIRIAIQVVNSISEKIGKLRDDDLWPQINELIRGLIKMWSVMLECHRIQCQALSEAKNLGSFALGGKISDAHMEVTKQLELELLEWVTSFSDWIHAQKSYVKALNGWLLIGLRYEPEETADGVAPFSPGRLGAPPVFVICNQWAQTVERISEKEVIDAMKAFASGVLHLWEQRNFEQRQSLMANKEMEKTLRIMEREEHEIHKAVEAQNKKLVQTGFTLSEHAEESNLQDSLRSIFEAMENFSASTLKAYEELQLRAEEERLIREKERIT